MTPEESWRFLLPGYLATITIETVVLLIALSPSHSVSRRIVAGVWLTACTYPIVILVLPVLLSGYTYLAVAETFAPVAECLLFVMAFHEPGKTRRRDVIWDCAAITVANLTSFGIGLVIVPWFFP